MSATTHTASELTPEEAERIKRLEETIEAERPDLIRRARLAMAAGDEPGFNGDLRRAIHSSRIPLEQIAEATGIQVFSLCDFLEGTAELTSGQIAAIVERLGLQLVRPILKDEKRAGSPPHKQGN